MLSSAEYLKLTPQERDIYLKNIFGDSGDEESGLSTDSEDNWTPQTRAVLSNRRNTRARRRNRMVCYLF